MNDWWKIKIFKLNVRKWKCSKMVKEGEILPKIVKNIWKSKSLFSFYHYKKEVKNGSVEKIFKKKYVLI